MNAQITTTTTPARPLRKAAFVGWLPLIVLPAAMIALGQRMAPWLFMWALAFAMFFGCKWLTWWQCREIDAPMWRHVGYLIAWVGMDARTFLDTATAMPAPKIKEWLIAGLKTVFGAALLWAVARTIPADEPLVRGWIGLIGIIFLLHFGTFHLLALIWRRVGVNAEPIMHAPILATSVAEFWGRRWNAGFHQLVNKLLFRRLHRKIGAPAAMMLVFLVSGIIHELVISLPARAGYGLPTAYFLIQGAGVLIERSRLTRKLGLRGGGAGWAFTFVITAGPAFYLFHPPFINDVIIPFMRVLRAI
jgi:hypothetical protein